MPPAIARLIAGAPQADSPPPEALAAFQAESIQAIVRRAYDGSAFYRAKLAAAGVSPGDIRGPADLHALPFLTKDELRGEPWILLTCDRRDVALVQVSTGTTGGEEIYQMYTWRDYLLHDMAPQYPRLFPVRPGDVCLNALPYEMSTAGLAFHKTFMEGYEATVFPAGKGGAYSTPEKTLKVIQDLRPTVIATTPSWSVMLAEEAARRGFDLGGMGLRKMWLTGEGCSPSFRGRVERTWGTVANFFYGSLECGVLGIECDAHQGYHVPEAHALVEIVDPATGAAAPPGAVGEIVVTALLRYDSPILRFRTGDLGILDTSPCTCGATLARLQLRGRASDQIRVGQRSLSPMYLEELLMRMPEVGDWYEIVLPGPGDAGIRIRCELARGAALTAGLGEALASRVQAAVGLPVTIDIVDRLPRPAVKVARVVKG